MPETMQAVVKVRPEDGGTEMQEVPVPEPGPKDVLIKNRIISICGTDTHIHKWDSWAAKRLKLPLIYGHEFAGEIVEVGSAVEFAQVGDYVSGECHIACGHCFNCRTGLAHICENVKIFGVDSPGVFAEYSLIPEANAWKNDPDLKPEYASIQDPLGNAIHTIFETDVPGNNVAIMGCGPIGIMAAAVCRHIGAAQIFAVGRRNEFRVNLAKEMGADHALLTTKNDVVQFIRDKTEGRGVDVVLEMSGNAKAVTSSLKALRPGGELALLGVFADKPDFDLSQDFVFKSIRMYGINGRKMYKTWYRMKGLLKGGLDIKKVITHKFKFSEFEEAMATMRGGNCGKVVLYLD